MAVRRVSRWMLAGVVLQVSFVCIGFGGDARAHGPDMAVTGILTGDAESPGLVRLTRGLAVADGESLQFICPERWGGPEAPGVAVLGDEVVVAGLRGPARVDADGRVTLLATAPELQAGRVRAVASDGLRVLALTTAGALWQLAPETPKLLAQLDDRPDTLAALGVDRWVLAGEDDGQLRLMELQLSGAAVQVSEPFVTTPFRANPALVVTRSEAGAATLWVVGTASDGVRLWRVDGGSLTRLAQTAEPIFGPVTIGDESFVVLGGQVHRVLGNAVEPVSATPRLFCLHALAGATMAACVGVDLHAYAPATGVGQALLQVAMLREPSLDGLDSTGAFGCRAEWHDAATDAGLPPERVNPAAWQAAEAGPEVVEPVGAVSGDGCAGGRGMSSLALAWWVCLWARRAIVRGLP